MPYAHYGFADYPDGQLRSSILDLANFLIMYLQDGAFNGQQLLSAGTLNEMLTPQVPALEATQGLNWYIEDIFLTGGETVSVWGHNGGESGVSTDMYIDPTNNMGVAVISNGEGDNLYVVDELYNYGLTLSASGVGNPPCESVGISFVNSAPSLIAYPIPASDFINVKLSSNQEVRISDTAGSIVFQRNYKQGTAVIPVTDIAPGIYLLSAKDDGGMNTHIFVISR